METMRVDSIAEDLGFDMRLKLILSRVEQLVNQQAAALVESKSLTCSLQRKVCYTASDGMIGIAFVTFLISPEL